MKKMIAHVYFYALPTQTKFVWQGKKYLKTSLEEGNNVKDLQTGKMTSFEGHYGCIIPASKAKALEINAKDYRPLEGSFVKVARTPNGKVLIRKISDERVNNLPARRKDDMWKVVSITDIYHPNAYTLSQIPEKIRQKIIKKCKI